MYQESGIHQSLLAAKACLVKKGLTMPKLELISAHMAANLLDNVRSAFEGNNLRPIESIKLMPRPMLREGIPEQSRAPLLKSVLKSH